MATKKVPSKAIREPKRREAKQNAKRVIKPREEEEEKAKLKQTKRRGRAGTPTGDKGSESHATGASRRPPRQSWIRTTEVGNGESAARHGDRDGRRRRGVTATSQVEPG